MSIQRNLLLACCLLSSLGLLAQRTRVEQSFGLAASTANLLGKARAVTDTSMVDSDYRLRLLRFGIVYSARVDILQWKFGSVSIGSPVMLGFSTSGKYRSTDFDGTTSTVVEGIKGVSLAFEIPVMIDLNIGLRSAATESNERFGFYVGAGYGYSYTKITTSVGKITYDGFDPVLRAGIRMGSRWEDRWSIGFSARGDFSNSSTRTYGLNIVKEL